MKLRERLRLLRLGLPTLAGWARRGYFIPYRYAAGLPAPGSLPPYRALEALFAAAQGEMAQLLREIEAHADALAAIGEDPAPAPRWRQDWFPRLDAAVAYTLVRRQRPRLIVEVGSGHSTRFLARALSDGAMAGRILAIDPAPRAAIAGLPGVTLQNCVLQEAAPELLAALGPGDILFIDSSHILMPGSDVDDLLNRRLPVLPSGVLVHLHDIFLPDDYPAAWRWRGYNEQQGVAALLQGGGYDILFASRYVVTRMPDALASGILARLPLLPGAYESSLWLRKI